MANKKFSDPSYPNTPIPADGDILLYENAAGTNSLNQTYAQLKNDVRLWVEIENNLEPFRDFLNIKLGVFDSYRLDNQIAAVQQLLAPDNFNALASWQSFTLATPQNIAGISFVNGDGTPTVNVFVREGTGTGGAIRISFLNLFVADSNELISFKFPEVTRLEAGVYTLHITASGGFNWGISESNVYAGGRFSADPNWDAAFEILSSSLYTNYNQSLVDTEGAFTFTNPQFGSEIFKLEKYQLEVDTQDDNFGAISAVATLTHNHVAEGIFGSNGVGAELKFEAPTTTFLAGRDMGALQYAFTDATEGSQNSTAKIEVIDNASRFTAATFDNLGRATVGAVSSFNGSIFLNNLQVLTIIPSFPVIAGTYLACLSATDGNNSWKNLSLIHLAGINHLIAITALTQFGFSFAFTGTALRINNASGFANTVKWAVTRLA